MAPIWQLATGVLLVLATWAALLAGLGLVGLPLARWIQGCGESGIGLPLVRRSIWWGFAVFSFLILLASLTTSLASSASLLAVVLPLGVVALVGLALLMRHGHRVKAAIAIRSTRAQLAVGVLLVVASFFALAALGPANNYDTGLYHLGAIKYAGEFGTVSGLANLYFPFGYANSHFAVAGWLSSTPWGMDGYRLINGLVVIMALGDLLTRWMEKRSSPGTWVLMFGLTAAAFPLISIADFWVTSPTSDSAVLLLSIVASAYLMDSVINRNPGDVALSIVTVVLMVAMRPTMLAFGLLVTLVSTISYFKSRNREPSTGSFLRAGIAVGSLAVALGGLQLARDRLLSGWLVYPLSYLPLEVPWRAPDPTPFRDATLAAARNPAAEDQYQVAHSWDWIGPWFINRWAMWETYLLLGLLVLGALAWWLLSPVDRRLRWRALGSLWLPSGLAILAWFIASPPSYRFAWGPLTVFAIAPLTAALVASDRTQNKGLDVGTWIPRACGGLAVVLVIVSVAFRIDYASISQTETWSLAGVSLRYAVAPQPEVSTTRVTTEGGVHVLIPDVGDQCWNTYPLCSPLPTTTLRYLGSELSAGFTS